MKKATINEIKAIIRYASLMNNKVHVFYRQVKGQGLEFTVKDGRMLAIEHVNATHRHEANRVVGSVNRAEDLVRTCLKVKQYTIH